MTGAGSFRRWLGCAPTIVARVSHGSAAWEPAQRFLNNHRTDVGRSQPCSDLTSGAAPRAPRDLHLVDGGTCKELARRTRTIPGSCLRGFLLKKQSCRFLIAQPNGVRLSCAAVLWFSQLQFYH